MRRRSPDPDTVVCDRLISMLPTVKTRLARQDVVGLARLLAADRPMRELVQRALEQPVPPELAIPLGALTTLRKAVALAQLGPPQAQPQPPAHAARLAPVPAAARL